MVRSGMNAIVSLAIVVFLLALAVWGLALAVTRRPPDRTYVAALAVGEVELVIQAAVALIVIASGHRPPSMGEYLGYLLATVILVPYAIVRARAPEANHWDSAVGAAVTFAVAIAVLRLLALW
jgi:hypothetical protein